ncbi:AfsR/SARP family transcriptional regulator [Streptomyces cavernae]|uniref:AfsR/SARP family transcriptional regulator n=1 Tax=Streptomyces cavernae TaxID=2259034 RepID=UPI001391DCE3|nr:BTAD domain-containing putative transcriptional regulator [Streptomyces cavernae]
MRFRILGPLEITSSAAAEPVRPRAAKIRAVLATLLVRANEIVSVDGLIDELWGEHPPRTATTTLQVYISQLRKLLHTADPEHGRDALVTRPPGYALYLDPAQLDLTVFEELHQGGQKALLRGDHEAAADLQRRALQLWRAPLASDTPHGALLARTAVRLAEIRAAALEQRMRAELQLGQHQRLIGELHSAVAEMPMREEFHVLLMTALYRAGRQADALRTFAELRRHLVAELAIEPGRQIQQLHQRILAGDPELLHPSPSPRPPRETAPDGTRQRTTPDGTPDGTAPDGTRLETAPDRTGHGTAPDPVRPPRVRLPGRTVDRLPPRDPVFVGRSDELDRLGSLLRDVPAGGCAAVAGAAGTGKTALAVAAGHELGDLFPDGRVFLELGGQRQADPADSLPRLLRRLGWDGPLPADEAELRLTLHRLTEGRRILLILDGAESSAEVRALLPNTPGSTALITCRRVPDGLTERVLELDVLPQDEARQLFTAAAGRLIPRYGGETAVREIAALCDGLPLALRAAAARLASRPNWGPEMLAARLRDEQRRLVELSAAAPGFHDRLRSCYEETEPALRHAFRRLGLVPAGPFGPQTAAAVLGEDLAKSGELLNGLVKAQLLGRVAGGPDHGTHRLYPLWRLLALECLATEGRAEEVREATARLAAEFTAQLRAAYGRAETHGTHPLEWFSRRQDGLVDVVRRCHAAGLWEATLQLADAMTGFLEARAAWDAWNTCHTLALEAARRQKDLAAEARMLRSLGDLAWQRRQVTTAAEFYERALLTADAAPAAAERGRALVGLADLQLDAGGLEEAAALLSPALDAVADDLRGRYEAHRVLGLLALEGVAPDAAEAHFTDCLSLATALRDPRLESYAQRWLDRVQGTGHRPPGWSEVRPGVWRLAPCRD